MCVIQSLSGEEGEGHKREKEDLLLVCLERKHKTRERWVGIFFVKLHVQIQYRKKK